MMFMIDPPSPFAPLQEWIAFLKEMEAIKPQTDQTKAAIVEAKAVIAAAMGSATGR